MRVIGTDLMTRLYGVNAYKALESLIELCGSVSELEYNESSLLWFVDGGVKVKKDGELYLKVFELMNFNYEANLMFAINRVYSFLRKNELKYINPEYIPIYCTPVSGAIKDLSEALNDESHEWRKPFDPFKTVLIEKCVEEINNSRNWIMEEDARYKLLTAMM